MDQSPPLRVTIDRYHAKTDKPAAEIDPGDACFTLFRSDGTRLRGGVTWALLLELIRQDQSAREAWDRTRGH